MVSSGGKTPWLAEKKERENQKPTNPKSSLSSWETLARDCIGNNNVPTFDAGDDKKGHVNELNDHRNYYKGTFEKVDELYEEGDVVEGNDSRWNKRWDQIGSNFDGNHGSEKPEFKHWSKEEKWGRKTWKEATESNMPRIVGDMIYGVGPVLAALLAGTREFYAVYVQTGLDLSSNNKKRKDTKQFEKILKLAQEIGLSRKEVSKHELNMMSDNRPHQGIVLDASPLEMVSINELDPVSVGGDNFKPPIWLALDEVMDPQNLGAIIRSAYFFGVSGVVLCAKNSSPLSGVVSKASAGALEMIEIRSCNNLMRFLSSSSENGWRVLGGSVSSKSVPVSEVPHGEPTILVMGSEGNGLRTLVERSCRQLIRIPGNMGVVQSVDIRSPAKDFTKFLAVESLNVSVSTGVLLYHLFENTSSGTSSSLDDGQPNELTLGMVEERLSIYRATRAIKRRENTLYNALRSIYEDSLFVGQISQLWPNLPLVANLRCGLWYFPVFNSHCYFKSTDGHNSNWSFNTSRLNLHIADLSGRKGGCIIVDSTRRGKRFPDSMSKTISIWTCVVNRAIRNYALRNLPFVDGRQLDASSYDWDCSLHLPLWVSKIEKAAIEDCLEEWTRQLEACGADIASIALLIKKPLRPLWISQRTLIWLNEVPDYDSWDFTPIILLSASVSTGIIQPRATASDFSWNYISGAGDDEETWARGLSPALFWKHSFDLINSEPGLCNQKVADIIERDRVYRSQRRLDKSVSVKSSNLSRPNEHLSIEDLLLQSGFKTDMQSLNIDDYAISWLGSTKIALGSSKFVTSVANFDCILNCSMEMEEYLRPLDGIMYLHLPTANWKFDRSSLLGNLPAALKFANLNLSQGKSLFVCCDNGEDISVCVCLAIFTSLFSDTGIFDDGKSFTEISMTKWEIRRRMVFICKYAMNARPSRGNLRQVFNYLYHTN